jgi:protein-S-isoprenylcysteine O-methyltransferase Ste14
MEPAKQSTPPKIGQAIVLVILFAMLLFAVVWASMAWSSADGVEMSIHGWIALSLGVVFSLVIGCGLMVLMFYSSRSGYDETASPHFRPNDTDTENDG